jgi:hypothetical protein
MFSIKNSLRLQVKTSILLVKTKHAPYKIRTSISYSLRRFQPLLKRAFEFLPRKEVQRDTEQVE